MVKSQLIVINSEVIKGKEWKWNIVLYFTINVEIKSENTVNNKYSFMDSVLGIKAFCMLIQVCTCI